jgi:hypothetical protein
VVADCPDAVGVPLVGLHGRAAFVVGFGEPAAALLFIDAAAEVVRTGVELGLTSDTTSQIKSGDVKEGDQLVLNPPTTLNFTGGRPGGGGPGGGGSSSGGSNDGGSNSGQGQ